MLIILVLAAPLFGVAGPASAAEDTQLTIAGKPKRGVYHDDIGPKTTPDVVRHQGKLTTAGGAPVANAPVQLQRQLVGGEWATQDGVTDEEGRYKFLTYIEGNASYKVVFAGDALYNPAESGIVKLKAMRDFNAELVEKKSHAVFKGNINPGWDNKVVVWQRKTCKSCSWKQVDKARSGDNGAWSFRGAYPPLNKKWVYRARIEGTDEFVESFSARLITTTTAGRERAARTVRR